MAMGPPRFSALNVWDRLSSRQMGSGPSGSRSCRHLPSCHTADCGRLPGSGRGPARVEDSRKSGTSRGIASSRSLPRIGEPPCLLDCARCLGLYVKEDQRQLVHSLDHRRAGPAARDSPWWCPAGTRRPRRPDDQRRGNRTGKLDDSARGCLPSVRGPGRRRPPHSGSSPTHSTTLSRRRSRSSPQT